MGFLCIFFGIIFLANPFFRMLDFLPDVIGCILIIYGTSKLACIDGRIWNARKYAIYFAFVSALKIPAATYIITNARDYLLPATFIFSVLEGILMVGIFVSLTGGLQYLLSREKSGELTLKSSEGASMVSFIFAVARAVISFLPEILSLGTQKDSFDYTFSPTAEMNAALMKPYAETLAFVLVMIIGTYFAFVYGKFLLEVRKNKTFVGALSERYGRYLEENTDTVNYRKVRFSLILLFAALLLLFNVTLDFVSIIPNILSYICLILASVYLIKSLGCEKLRATLPLYIPLAALSIYNNSIQTRLLSETNIDFIYDKMLIRNIPELLRGTDELWWIAGLVVLEYFLLAILAINICKALDSIEFLRDKDTISIFEILLAISSGAYFISTAYVYFGQHILTAFTFIYEKLDVYVRYDSILVIYEWVRLATFFIMLYFAYRYGTDILSRVKAEKEDTEY